MTIVGTFAWLRGPKGPEATKWPAGSTVPQRADVKDRILAEHPLNEGEFGLSLLILEIRYPAPVVADEAHS